MGALLRNGGGGQHVRRRRPLPGKELLAGIQEGRHRGPTLVRHHDVEEPVVVQIAGSHVVRRPRPGRPLQGRTEPPAAKPLPGIHFADRGIARPSASPSRVQEVEPSVPVQVGQVDALGHALDGELDHPLEPAFAEVLRDHRPSLPELAQVLNGNVSLHRLGRRTDSTDGDGQVEEAVFVYVPGCDIDHGLDPRPIIIRHLEDTQAGELSLSIALVEGDDVDGVIGQGQVGDPIVREIGRDHLVGAADVTSLGAFRGQVRQGLLFGRRARARRTNAQRREDSPWPRCCAKEIWGREFWSAPAE